MDKALKEKWIQNLTDGTYEQGYSQLFDGHGYCCLGVLCDISDKGQWGKGDNYLIGNYTFHFTLNKDDQTDGFSAPYVGDELFGLPKGIASTLMRMNDGGDLDTTDGIASWLLDHGVGTDPEIEADEDEIQYFLPVPFPVIAEYIREFVPED